MNVNYYAHTAHTLCFSFLKQMEILWLKTKFQHWEGNKEVLIKRVYQSKLSFSMQFFDARCSSHPQTEDWRLVCVGMCTAACAACNVTRDTSWKDPWLGLVTRYQEQIKYTGQATQRIARVGNYCLCVVFIRKQAHKNRGDIGLLSSDWNEPAKQQVAQTHATKNGIIH